MTGGGQQKAAAGRGLAASLARLARTFAATLHSRAELFALEIARERSRVVRLLLLVLMALVFLTLAAFTATIFVILLFWEGHRLLAAGVLVIVYAAIAGFFAAAARKEALAAAQPFSATLEQLRKDRDALT